MRKLRSGRILLGVKLAIGFGLLGILLLRDDAWREVGSLAGQLDVPYLVPLLVITIAILWISCVKWQLFLREGGSRVSIGSLIRLYLIGFFFNNFFVGSFGGDLARSYLLGRDINAQGRAFATVFLERLSGFIAMVSLAAIAYLITPSLQADPIVSWSVSVMLLGTVVLSLLIAQPRLFRSLARPLARYSLASRVLDRLDSFRQHVAFLFRRPKLMAKAMLYSYAFYGMAALAVYIAGLVIGVRCDLQTLFVISPIVMLIAAIPITPNGLGIWEWGWSAYLVTAGATIEQGLAIALLFRIRDIFIAGFGGLLFLIRRKQDAALDVNQVAEPVQV